MVTCLFFFNLTEPVREIWNRSICNFSLQPTASSDIPSPLPPALRNKRQGKGLKGCESHAMSYRSRSQASVPLFLCLCLLRLSPWSWTWLCVIRSCSRCILRHIPCPLRMLKEMGKSCNLLTPPHPFPQLPSQPAAHYPNSMWIVPLEFTGCLFDAA